MKLKIKITKDILERAKMCGHENLSKNSENCAIALAVRDLFPKAAVGTNTLCFRDNNCSSSLLPPKACEFIVDFDRLHRNPHDRPLMPELEFEIDVPEEVIESISINEAQKILSESKTLKLI